MWIVIVTLSYLLSQNCLGLNLIDLPDSTESDMNNFKERIQRRNNKFEETSIKPTTKDWQFRQISGSNDQHKAALEEEIDENLKSKLTSLGELTMYDTEEKIKTIQILKETYGNSSIYKIGFIISLVKKAVEVLNELFNVAVKHRDSWNWKALEQLKVFDLIIHTNVDTTNLVRILVDIHDKYQNSTNSGGGRRRYKFKYNLKL